ncbi:MAG TPA: ABC transporter ATP-binding protein [Candidatus Olsenella avistercoris]|nr:ABC transporter ATP-binding protein [Candidatus Olsenella avistercoris]
MEPPVIRLEGVSKTFTTQNGSVVKALDDITFDVNERDFVSIIGPSGCGKSTILRLISGLDQASSGSISLSDAVDKDGFGYVFQDSVLLPWKTVKENIAFPLEIKGDEDGEGAKRVERLLKTVGLEGFANSYPKELSGGMRQRTSIARSLSYDPDVLLMDEPFGALDALTRDSLNVELRRIWKDTSKTIVFVTHDIDEAVFLSTKVVVLSGRPSKVREVVPIELEDDRDLSVRSNPRFHAYADTLRGMLE